MSAGVAIHVLNGVGLKVLDSQDIMGYNPMLCTHV